jgi:FMN phosphatase YigB (HAD superfamily)
MKIDDNKIILCDIDDTITSFKGDYNAEDYVNEIFSLFASALAEKNHISFAEARQQVDDYAAKLIWWDYPDFIAEFELPHEPVWQALRQIHQQRLIVFDDAVAMIKAFYKRGKTMCIISNNPVTGCLLKLEVAGLAEMHGSKYFTRIFGTNVTKGIKNKLTTWQRTIATLGVSPAEMITIGDSFKEDFEIPHTAGVEQTVIIDRASAKATEVYEGYIRVNNLMEITQ